MDSQIVVGFLAFLGVVVTGILAIVNSRIQKRGEKLEVQKSSNDRLELQNNIIEQLVPVFEKKDFALDRIADILEQMIRNQEFIDISLKNLSKQLANRCLAPDLLEELKEIQARKESRCRSAKELKELIGEEVAKANSPGKDDI
jgi:hypothetical protein